MKLNCFLCKLPIDVDKKEIHFYIGYSPFDHFAIHERFFHKECFSETAGEDWVNEMMSGIDAREERKEK